MTIHIMSVGYVISENKVADSVFLLKSTSFTML